MTFRRSLTAALAAAMLLTACAGDDAPDTTDATETTEIAEPAADQPAADPTHPTDDAAAGGTRPAAVALTFDGQRVPIAAACNGVDGAVLATTEGEVTITLVQEEGTALRYQGEGMTAETTEVEIEQVGISTIYRATLESEEVPSVEVELEVGDTSALADC